MSLHVCTRVSCSAEPGPSILADALSDVSVDVGFLHPATQRRAFPLSHLSSYLPQWSSRPLLSTGVLSTQSSSLCFSPQFFSLHLKVFSFLFLLQKCYHFLFQRYRLEHYTVSSNWLALSAVMVFTVLSLSRSVALFRGL